MRQWLKDTGFRWPKKPPNASEVKFNTAFKQDIDQCINYAYIKDKEKLESLLTNNFQSFKNIKILPV